MGRQHESTGTTATVSGERRSEPLDADDTDERRSGTTDVDRVDPRAPRFGQTLTTVLLLAGIGLQRPVLVGATAVVLATAVVTRWRVDLWGLLWVHLALPVVGAPDRRETAAPHRFAKLLGAAGTGLASVAFLADLPLVGFGLAAAVALAAGLAASTGLCLGCKLYGQVRFFQRHDIV